MANEITLQVGVNLTRAVGGVVNFASGNISLNQTGSRGMHSVENILTTATALGSVLSPLIGTLGYTLIQSLDTSTNGIVYVLTTTGATTGAAIAQLGPGDMFLVKAGAGLLNLAAIAGVTTTPIRVVAMEL